MPAVARPLVGRPFAIGCPRDGTLYRLGRFALAASIAIDATIVRTMLVSAFMILLGKANWWFPEPLERRLPRLGIEGEDFLEDLDAEGEVA